ncbi:CDP-glycerol glycerophosphotransferase family protein [Nocardioides renjunii]|uniref:CDP-glycerol glycerophosphotransferase family protein n=1 Tax=Nocardioides renjunii TaxID=3095075 RepID=UPI002AFE847E|nr:CDP-glycerol glycerophosphotransferase family protein [Nocardioides sp. S-34]WQQ24373.1 CDP-glycerol glycerophosphotransferase family protein [Nocardioides sp. S-34]
MNAVPVVAYFAGDPSRTYQLVQWLEVLEVLDDVHRVCLVLRDPEAAELVAARTRLRVVTAPTLADLSAVYAELDAKVVLYCNNSVQNFDSLLDSRRLHVHVNHGESDKQSMASNNAKAYDRVFVAGEAAVQRYVAELLELDARRLVRIGRPQLDLRRTPLLEPSERSTVLYAPTWEGDAAYNDYTSVDVMGPAIVRAVLAVPGVRLVYKPHPKVVTSRTPAVAAAHREVLDVVAEAAGREPGAGHTAVVEGDILAVMPVCDAIVTDVSSVGLDWLYLHTDKPIVLTDRHEDDDRLRQHVPLSRCSDVVRPGEVDGLSELLRDRLQHDEHRLARTAMRHHYFDDLHVGDSTVRFLGAVSELVALRDRLLGEAGGAITA